MINQQHIKDIVETTTSLAETSTHLLKTQESSYESTPRGVEAKYLQSLLDHYSSEAKFIKYFIALDKSGNIHAKQILDAIVNNKYEGKDKSVITYLEKLINHVTDKQQHSSAKDHDIYETVLKLLDELKINIPIDSFLEQISHIRTEAINKSSILATDIKKHKLSKIDELEKYHVYLDALKFIVSKLARPNDLSKVNHITGNVDTTALIKRIKEITNTSEGDIKNSLNSMFEKEHETDMDNLLAFTTTIAQEGNKNIFINLLNTSSYSMIKDMSKRIMTACGSKNNVISNYETLVPQLIHLIDVLIKVESKFKESARNEFKKLITDHKDKIEQDWSKEFKNFKNVLENGIKTLRKDHEAGIKKLKTDTTQLSKISEELISDLAYTSQLVEKHSDLTNQYKAISNKIFELQNTTRAIILLQGYSLGYMDNNQLSSRLDNIMPEHPTEKKHVIKMQKYPSLVDSINKIRTFVNQQINNQISTEEFTKHIQTLIQYNLTLFVKIDELTNKLDVIDTKINTTHEELSEERDHFENQLHLSEGNLHHYSDDLNHFREEHRQN